MDINAVRRAVAAQITSVIPAPLTCSWFVPDAVIDPWLYVQPDRLDYDLAMKRGLDSMTFKLYLLVSKADDQAAQQQLDAYISGTGALSIKAALEAGRGAPGQAALGGVCDDLRVTAVDSYQFYTIGSTVYLGAVFELFVIGSGNG